MDFKTVLHHINDEQKQKKVVTHFLTTTEQAQARQILNSSLDVAFDGGYDNAERKRLFLHAKKEDYIKAIQLAYNKEFLETTHQNILGTILSLGVEYNRIGDIIADQDIIIVEPDIIPILQRNFTSINNVMITLEEIDPTTITYERQTDDHIAYVSSMRLDQIVSKLSRCSRKSALHRIKNKLVKVNHIPVMKPAKRIEASDIISIRKSGRYIIHNADKQSKKGKIIVEYGKYV